LLRGKLKLKIKFPIRWPAVGAADSPKFQRLFELLLKDETRDAAGGQQDFIDGGTAKRAARSRRLFFQLTDNGPGLPQEALSVVFDPFVVRARGRRANTAST